MLGLRHPLELLHQMLCEIAFPGPITPEKIKSDTKQTPNGTRYCVYGSHLKTNTVILYSYGNRESLESVEARCREISTVFNSVVVSYDYPGYDGKADTITEEKVYGAIEQVYLAACQSFPRKIFWGKSVGGGATCYLASRYECDKLILESCFTSVLRVKLPWVLCFFAADILNNIDRVASFRTKTVVIFHHHGDTLINYMHAVDMHNECERVGKASVLVLIPGGEHNTPIDPRFILEHVSPLLIRKDSFVEDTCS